MTCNWGRYENLSTLGKLYYIYFYVEHIFILLSLWNHHAVNCYFELIQDEIKSNRKNLDEYFVFLFKTKLNGSLEFPSTDLNYSYGKMLVIFQGVAIYACAGDIKCYRSDKCLLNTNKKTLHMELTHWGKS